MRSWDAGRALRVVSALRALCLALPHLPTPAEAARLARFEVLVASPGAARADDIEAVRAGWRRWWREGRTDDLLAMALELPATLIWRDRWLASYAVAAGATLEPGDTARLARALGTR